MPEPHPSSCGSISHGIPLRRTKTIPVRHARLGTRGLPPLGRDDVTGRNGSTTSRERQQAAWPYPPHYPTQVRRQSVLRRPANLRRFVRASNQPRLLQNRIGRRRCKRWLCREFVIQHRDRREPQGRRVMKALPPDVAERFSDVINVHGAATSHVLIEKLLNNGSGYVHGSPLVFGPSLRWVGSHQAMTSNRSRTAAVCGQRHNALAMSRGAHIQRCRLRRVLCRLPLAQRLRFETIQGPRAQEYCLTASSGDRCWRARCARSSCKGYPRSRGSSCRASSCGSRRECPSHPA